MVIKFAFVTNRITYLSRYSLIILTSVRLFI